MVRGIDQIIIRTAERWSIPLTRAALFVVYFWFGALKLFATSPANSLVENLLQKTLPFVTFGQFIIFLGILEAVIGITFLIRGWERVAFALVILHMLMACAPLLLLPGMTWNGFLVPTLEGQYIIKNLLIIALALGLVKMSGRK